jgi:dephospho-CoA kinase
MKLYGLTGGIASGKSAVTRILRTGGVTVLDLDQIARDVVAPGTEGLGQLEDAFGAGYVNLDGTLDRRRLADLVFNDAAELAKLDAIMGPLMWADVERQLERLERVAGVEFAFLDAALIFEKGLQEKLDGVLVVTADPDVRMRRAMARDGATEEHVRARMDAQMSDPDKLLRADFVIDNSGTLDELEGRVAAALREIRG